MSSTWLPLRSAIVANLATSDPDIESTQPQTYPVGWATVAPSRQTDGARGDATWFAVMVLGFTAADPPVFVPVGTVDLQVIEVSPDPNAAVTKRKLMYAGRDPVAALKFGRAHLFRARYLHQLGVRLSGVTGTAAVLQVYWRPVT